MQGGQDDRNGTHTPLDDPTGSEPTGTRAFDTPAATHPATPAEPEPTGTSAFDTPAATHPATPAEPEPTGTSAFDTPAATDPATPAEPEPIWTSVFDTPAATDPATPAEPEPTSMFQTPLATRPDPAAPDEPEPTSMFQTPLAAKPEPAMPSPPATGPSLPSSEPLAPVPMVHPVAHRSAPATWYRSDQERAKSVYRRANPWYRRAARGVVGLAFLAIAAIAAYAGARAVQSYLDRDRLPDAGAEVPAIRATSFLVSSTAPGPTIDGTLTVDVETLAFEFVGRATGPQSGLQVVSPDGTAVYVRQGTAPWRAAAVGDTVADAVGTAVRYLADDDSADAILTSHLRRGFVDLLDRVEEGAGENRLIRYEMTFDTAELARDFPLQWQSYQDEAVPGAVVANEVPVTIWLDAEDVLMRVDERGANWAWERLTYSDQPFRPIDPADEGTTRIVQVACVSSDNTIFWQTPLPSCDAAIAAARDAAATAGLADSFDDLDRTIAHLCSAMEREDGSVAVTAAEADLATELVAAGVCRGDPAVFTTG